MISVVMPSRGRPERARSAIEAMRSTAALVATSIALVVDADDPELEAYRALSFPTQGPEVATIVLQPADSGDLVRATNTVALRIAQEDPSAIIGNLGDDHVVRTPGWDRLVADALTEPGIAYGDDLLQGQRLPTAPFISARIVLALGWYFLPTAHHLYVDDVVRELGHRLRLLRYLPDLVIEHVHPGAHKADWDEGYQRANGAATLSHDRQAYEDWLRTRFRADARAVARALTA